MDHLQEFRLRGIQTLAVLCWLCVAMSGLDALLNSGDVLGFGFSVVLALGPTWLAVRGRSDAAARITVGATLPLFAAVFLMQAHQQAWQTDVHMVFFALIAAVAILADWRPLIAATLVTALHHLLTNYIAPSYVFPEGGSLARVLFHAVIVVIETAVLIKLTIELEKLVIGQAAAQAEQAAAEAKARALRESVDAEQRLVIGAISDRLHLLAGGNLAARVEESFPPAYESVRGALNQACADLEALVSQVDISTGMIRTGAAEVRSASDDLALRTEEQASSLERMADTTQRVTKDISGTAQRSLEARDSTLAAKDSAAQGSQVVESAIAAMHLIEQSANEIGQIITLIDGISFQTNLLALNAGVEAARAGDAGKGFAVVANEVRALAQRSADAAQTIKNLILSSSSQVEQGVKLVGESGAVLGQIAEQVSTISDTISQIAGSAQAQAEELKVVSSNFARIDTSTQQNAAMVEESNAAAHHLLAEAECLGELVSRFSTGNRETNRQLMRAA